MASSSLSTLPRDLLVNIVGRIPSYHCREVVALVSKRFNDLVGDPVAKQIRRRLDGKVSLYLSFTDTSVKEQPRSMYLLSGRANDPKMNQFVNIQFPAIDAFVKSIITDGPNVFFICQQSTGMPVRLFVYDSRSGESTQCPDTQVQMRYHSSGLVGGKIHVIGYRHNDPNMEYLVESFDLATKTWGEAQIREAEAVIKNKYRTPAIVSATIDKKVYAFYHRGVSTHSRACYYDPRDGTCGFFDPCSYADLGRTYVCVIDNILYLFDSKLGLMWYDSAQWGAVSGLDLKIVQESVEKAWYDELHPSVGMAKYHGKLAFVWIKSVGAVNEIWGTRIALARSETGIHATSEPFELLGTVPLLYKIRHFFSVLDY